MISGIATFAILATSQILAGRVVDAPTTVSIRAHVGDYYVYQLVGTESGGFGFSISSRGPSTLDSDQVVVIAPTRARSSTWSGDGSETITEGSAIYADAVGFHVSSPGVYEVTIAAASPRSMIVAPSVGSSFASAAPWLILCVPGTAGVVSGGVLLILGQRRRRRLEASAPVAYQSGPSALLASPPGSPPPGWYRDPSGSFAWRWWDGRSWTSHTASHDPFVGGP